MFQINKYQKKQVSILNQRIEKYKVRSLFCEICLSNNYKILSKEDRYGIRMDYGICKICGLIQSIKKFENTSYSEFYERFYNNIYSFSEEKFKSKFFENRKKVGEKIYKFLNKNIHLKKEIKILEIGCGTGGIVACFSEKGFDTLGIDLSSEDIKFGLNKNLKLLHKSIDDLKKNQKFDLIISMRSLEHIPDPNSFLFKVKKHMTEDGFIYINVPSLNSLFYTDKANVMSLKRQFHFAHVYLYSIDTLSNLMFKNNFKRVVINQNIESIWSKNLKNTNYEVKNFFIKTSIQILILKYFKSLIIFKNILKFYIKKLIQTKLK